MKIKNKIITTYLHTNLTYLFLIYYKKILKNSYTSYLKYFSFPMELNFNTVNSNYV